MAGYEYKDIFLEEVEEQLDILNNALLALEDDPDNVNHMHAIFRVTHTLKSSAAFVGLNELSDFAHKVESLLQLILDDKVEADTEIIDLLFTSFDNIKEYINKFSKDQELDIDFTGLQEQVIEIIDKRNSESKEVKDTAEDKTGLTIATEEDEEIIEVNVTLDFSEEEIKAIVNEGMDNFNLDKGILDNIKDKSENIYYINVFLEENVKMKWVRGELILVSLEKMGKVIDTIPSSESLKTDDFERTLEILFQTKEDEDALQKACDVDQVAFIIIEKLTKQHFEDTQEKIETTVQLKDEEKVEDIHTSYDTDGEDIEDSIDDFAETSGISLKKSSKGKSSKVSSKNILSQSQSVRVPIEKLDSLLNLVGELAIVNSGFIEVQERIRSLMGTKGAVVDLKDKIETLSNIAKSLQEGIMQSRMVPIGFVISRFNRLVRDLSINLKKNVNLVMHGEDTELDKKIIDAIGEPLIHLVRNAIDHGIEPEEERIEKGKAPAGTLELNAYQRGNHIIIDVNDDGRGMDENSIVKKAVKVGLITEAEANSMDDQQIYNLVFEPGFSTAIEVTDLSGRGMGMNIVKETVEQLNGSVTITSELGVGTTFSLAFPLTMAIIPAILSTVGDEVFAIPLYNVFETLKVKPSEIETIDFKEVLRVRDEVIELCRLEDLVDGKSKGTQEDGKIPVLVVEYDNLRIGIVVDSLIGKREIVTKSISHYFKEKELDGISGAAILGNGKIALILDVLSLVKRFKSEHGNKKTIRFSKEKTENRNKVDEFMPNEESESQILEKLNTSETTFKSICELYKIGISNASKNISKFLMANLVISAPVVRLHSVEQYKKHEFYYSEGKYFICEMDFTDNASGKFVLVLDDDSIKDMFKLIIGEEPDMHSELVASSIKETTNIVGASITNTLSSALKMTIYVSTPTLSHMKLDEYFNTVLSNYKIDNQYIWAILANIMLDNKTLEGKIYIIPDHETFHKMKNSVDNDKELLKFIESTIL